MIQSNFWRLLATFGHVSREDHTGYASQKEHGPTQPPPEESASPSRSYVPLRKGRKAYPYGTSPYPLLYCPYFDHPIFGRTSDNAQRLKFRYALLTHFIHCRLMLRALSAPPIPSGCVACPRRDIRIHCSYPLTYSSSCVVSPRRGVRVRCNYPRTRAQLACHSPILPSGVRVLQHLQPPVPSTWTT